MIVREYIYFTHDNMVKRHLIIVIIVIAFIFWLIVNHIVKRPRLQRLRR